MPMSKTEVGLHSIRILNDYYHPHAAMRPHHLLPSLPVHVAIDDGLRDREALQLLEQLAF